MSRDMESLIGELLADFRPVKKMAHPLARVLPWIIFATVYTAAAVYILGLRPDLADKFTEPGYLFELGLMLTIGVTAALSAGWLCVPDMRGMKSLPALPLGLAAIFLLWQAWRLLTEGPDLVATPERCIGDGILLGAVPAALIVFISRKGATTRPGLMAMMNTLAVSAFGYIGLRMTCPADTPGHALFWHCLPFIAFGILMGSLARWLYRW